MTRRLSVLCALALAGCPKGEEMMMPGTGPKILSTTPAAMATNVSATTSFVIEFSAEMNIASVALTLTPAIDLNDVAWNESHTIATYDHTMPFEFSTEYTVRVAGADPAGNKITGTTAFAFTTAAAPENQAPTLVSSVPMNLASNVAPNTTLSLTFSEAMDPASLMLTSLPVFDWGLPTWGTGNTVVTFPLPPSMLTGGTSYALVINGADTAGNLLAPVTLSFTTAAGVDTTAPVVDSTSPAAGANGVSPNASPSVTFSEPMAAGTIAALVVSPDAGCVPVLDATKTLLTCTHAALLAPDASYTVTVLAAAAKDLAMNSLAADFSFSFGTGSAPDVTPPALTAMVPADGGFGFQRSQPMFAYFSEPMDKAATQAALVLNTPAGREVYFSWNDGGTAVAMRVDGGFAYGDSVAWAVGTGARDLAGNAIAAGGTGTFNIRKLCSGVHLKSDSTRDGYAVAATSLGRPSYGMSTGSSVLVGRSAPLTGESLYRGVFVFPVGSGSTCTSTGVASTALAVTQAVLSSRQTAYAGEPFQVLGREGVIVDVIDFAPGQMDAGVVFQGCRSGPCTGVTFSTGKTLGIKSASVAREVGSALDEGLKAGRITFRVVNPYAESIRTQLDTSTTTYLDGAGLDGGAALDLSYEYP